jgi:DNA replication factor GINS
MSESKRIDVNSLYTVLLREIENDIVQEVNTDLYSSISEYLGQLKSEGYDGLEAKVKAALVNMVTEMTSFLLKIRIEKSIKSNTTDYFSR